MSTAHHPLTALRAVRSAFSEDAEGRGLRVHRSIASRLGRICGRGCPLPHRLQRAFEDEFGRDLGRVRVHEGAEVDALARWFEAGAFCVGTHVYLAGRLRGGPDRSLRHWALCHELAHVAGRVEPDRVRFWNLAEHASLTERACDEFSRELDALVRIPRIGLKKGDLIQGLKIASSNMDYRHAFSHLGDTVDYLFGSAKGQGPPHGEAYNYDRRCSIHDNVLLNQIEQKRHIQLAGQEFQEDRNSDDDDDADGYTIRLGDTLAIDEKEWVKSLGNALHVAQDRASHREGTAGYGHDDPRCRRKPAWKPDRPVHDHRRGGHWLCCSKAAYNRAINNSYDVLEEFFRSINIPPHTAERKSESCAVVWTPQGGPARIYYSPYPNPMNRTVTGQFAGPHGRHLELPAPFSSILERYEFSQRRPLSGLPSGLE